MNYFAEILQILQDIQFHVLYSYKQNTNPNHIYLWAYHFSNPLLATQFTNLPFTREEREDWGG